MNLLIDTHCLIWAALEPKAMTECVPLGLRSIW